MSIGGVIAVVLIMLIATPIHIVLERNRFDRQPRRPRSPEENDGMCICGSDAKDHPGFTCRFCGGCV